MAAESTEDKDVDALITELQGTLDKLKAAQGKDVKDETGGEGDYSEGKETPRENQPADLRGATVRVREHMRRLRKQ